MQQHPVPQNVIGFQFKLVGDMTLKQFGYLAGGAAAAFLTSKLPYPSIFTYPLAGILAFFGFALAFLPVEERPLDIWVKNFITSIFSPTQFYYHKTGGNLDFLNVDLTRTSATSEIIEKSLKKDKYQDYLKTLSPARKNVFDVAENRYLKSLDFGAGGAITPAPSPKPVQKTEEEQLKIQQVFTQDYHENAYLPLASISKQPRAFEDIKVRPLFQQVKGEIVLSTPPVIPVAPRVNPIPPHHINEQFQKINVGKLTTTTKRVTQEVYRAPAAEIKNKPASFEHFKFSPFKKTEGDNPELEELSRKEVIKKRMEELNAQQTKEKASIKQTFSYKNAVDANSLRNLSQTPQTPKTPNIVCGVVLDHEDKPVNGAIVEIKNMEGTNVRTLKSNLLGQFSVATPLLNGEYIIVIEKDGLSFDNVKFILDNTVIGPIVIKAK
jgi:hypothetical protein